MGANVNAAMEKPKYWDCNSGQDKSYKTTDKTSSKVKSTRKTTSQTTTKTVKDIKERREWKEGRDVVLPSSLNRLKQKEGYLLRNKGKWEDGDDLLVVVSFLFSLFF
jgi:hypothetical protein